MDTPSELPCCSLPLLRRACKLDSFPSLILFLSSSQNARVDWYSLSTVHTTGKLENTLPPSIFYLPITFSSSNARCPGNPNVLNSDFGSPCQNVGIIVFSLRFALKKKKKNRYVMSTRYQSSISVVYSSFLSLFWHAYLTYFLPEQFFIYRKTLRHLLLPLLHLTFFFSHSCTFSLGMFLHSPY